MSLADVFGDEVITKMIKYGLETFPIEEIAKPEAIEKMIKYGIKKFVRREVANIVNVKSLGKQLQIDLDALMIPLMKGTMLIEDCICIQNVLTYTWHVTNYYIDLNKKTLLPIICDRFPILKQLSGDLFVFCNDDLFLKFNFETTTLIKFNIIFKGIITDTLGVVGNTIIYLDNNDTIMALNFNGSKKILLKIHYSANVSFHPLMKTNGGMLAYPSAYIFVNDEQFLFSSATCELTRVETKYTKPKQDDSGKML